MRVFPDTNVLASAFGTRGLCAEILTLILAEHELLTGEIIVEELTRVLLRKFAMPPDSVGEFEDFLRGFHVEAKPAELPNLALGDRNDLIVIASALNARAEVVLTGDREMLALKSKPTGLQILSPREFWNLSSRPVRQRRRR